MYLDAFFDRDADVIRIVERRDGERKFIEYPVKYTFYYEDPKGKYTSIYGDPLSRIVCKNTKEYRKELAINKNKRLFESDINPIFQCLSENYINVDAPKLNVAFFDIETDFDPERGFAPPSDPFMPITAITVHLQWLNALITVAVPPRGLPFEEAKAMCQARWGDSCILFPNDREGNGNQVNITYHGTNYSVKLVSMGALIPAMVLSTYLNQFRRHSFQSNQSIRIRESITGFRQLI